MSPNRRDFLKKVAATQAGLAFGGASTVVNSLVPGRESEPQSAVVAKPVSGVIVVGAVEMSVWTAYYLATMVAKVTLVDAYGPGNSRATSGDETRGVRTSYGDKGIWSELWASWASEAINRWTKFDAEWGREMKVRLFFNTGDLIFRAKPEAFTQRNQELWKKFGIPFSVLKVEDVAREFPVFDLREITVALHEPRAGVVRARRACEVVAEAFRQAGGQVVLGYASVGEKSGNRLQNIKTAGPAATLTADTYVFALGPWMPKAFPSIMQSRIRTPMGHVHYFGT